MVTFGNGESYRSGTAVNIPEPQRLYIRLPGLGMVEAMTIAADTEAMNRITTPGRAYNGCKLIAVSNEAGTPRISAKYTTMEELS